MNATSEAERTAAALHAAISLFTRRARETKSGELSLPERTALSRLDRKGPTTTAGLARWEEISPQAMGVTVAALESRGYLTRSADPTDGRRAILTITPEGVAVSQASRGQLTQRISATLDEQFTTEDMKLLRLSSPLIERLAELI
jgi:DNA-binding MarR family transcriptional regulator